MSLVFAAVCSHAPGITGRAHLAEPETKDAFHAAFLGMPWPEYLQAMRDGVAQHGPVRAGVYTMTTGMDEKVAGL